jgi:hypothetical protein
MRAIVSAGLALVGLLARPASSDIQCSTDASIQGWNGDGWNSTRLSATNLPVAGAVWQIRVNCRGIRAGVVVLQVRTAAFDGLMTQWGQTLIAGPLLGTMSQPFAEGEGSVTFDIPISSDSCSESLAAQASIVVPNPFRRPPIVGIGNTNADIGITGN